MGNAKVQNIIILGALIRAMALEPVDWPALVAGYVPATALALNLQALDAGLRR
jgi:indolepyruvate ferredoxin oxidoreductase beta subunit